MWLHGRGGGALPQDYSSQQAPRRAGKAGVEAGGSRRRLMAEADTMEKLRQVMAGGGAPLGTGLGGEGEEKRGSCGGWGLQRRCSQQGVGIKR